MPSPFDQYVLPTSDFIPEYQGMPLAQLESGAKRLEDRYLQNLSESTKFDIMNAERRSLEGDAEANQRISQKYAETIDSMAKAGNYEHMTDQVAALAKEYARDPERKAIQDSYRNYMQEQELVQKMGAQGKQALFTGDAATHRSYDPETGKANIYNPRVEEMLDYEKRMAGIWSDLTPDAGIKNLSQKEQAILGEDLQHFINYGVWKGISNNKVEVQQLDNAVNSYMISPEGRQQKKKYLSENPGMTSEQADAMIRGDVLDRGQLKIFGVSDIALNRLPVDKGGDASGGGQGWEELQADSLVTDLGFDIDDFEIRQRSDLDNVDSTERLTKTSSGTLAPNAKAEDSSRYTGVSNKATDEETAAFNEAAKAGLQIFSPGTISSGLTHSQKLEYAQKYQDLVKDRMMNMKINTTDHARESFEMNRQPTSVTQNELLTDVQAISQRQAEQRSYYDINTGITFTPSDGDSYSENFQEYIGDPNNILIAGTIDPKNHFTKKSNNPRFADAYTITVRDPKEGTSRQLLMTRQESAAANAFGTRAKAVNDIYNTFSLLPNQQKEIDILGIPVKGQMDAAVQGEDIINTGLTVSIGGGKPRYFESEEDLVDKLMTILSKQYGEQ